MLKLKTFNAKLIAFELLIFVVISVRLYLAALETGNYKGAFFSMFHVGIVALGSYFALKR